MDITRVKSAIASVQSEIKNVVDSEIKARSFDRLRALASVDTAMGKAVTKLEKIAAPKAAKEKKAKKEKADKK